jgi:hypothetical protein
VVALGAPYFLRDCDDTFHVFLYAPRAEKIRRIIADGGSPKEAEDWSIAWIVNAWLLSNITSMPTGRPALFTT